MMPMVKRRCSMRLSRVRNETPRLLHRPALCRAGGGPGNAQSPSAVLEEHNWDKSSTRPARPDEIPLP